MSSEMREYINNLGLETIRAVPFHWGHLYMMEVSEDQRKTMEFMPQYNEIISHYASIGHSCTVLHEGKPVVCFGNFQVWPGVHELWMITDQPSVKEHPWKLTKLTRLLADWIENHTNCHRLQLVVRRDNVSHCKWAELIGFKYETTLHKYTPDGRDCNFYVRLK